ncbi:hypothetical protein ITJ55_15155 [Frigoribacterium sp. VKM Ac-1396]|jgi:hypothetical protein|uniref:hypothetical protein n=1 Tax=Frigoribacterium sp. VKM Ac-1396 TaxID=2783821 RepID=UPI00188BC2A3|nr:hypothetical protein [Frigoribacterium sp. VKM Ac-1396]MBF4602145.1 hypothetical protein [Frigoribacterium sp. VKM Ac-1396]
MTTIDVARSDRPSTRSTFSEVRDTARQRTLAVIATAATGASVSLVAALLLALGVIR